MTTEALADRIRWVMARAGFAGKNQGSAFSRHCGLRSRTHVNLFLSGGRTGIDEPTARAIGRKTGVSWYWLETGKGERTPYEGDDAPPTMAPVVTRYPNLEAAIAYHLPTNPGRWSDTTVAAMRGIALQLDHDPSPDDWTGRLDALEVVMRRLAVGGAPGPKAEVAAPPAATRFRRKK